MLRSILFATLAVLVVLGHVALWASDAPYDAKLRLTVLNALSWAVIVLPAIGVSFWLKARTRGRL